jgi:hypothetical protein
MKSTISASAIAAILSASMALGNPINARAAALTCNTAPTASVPNTGAPAPLASPAATTAEKCQEQCAANSACQCFAFGLAADATTPTCRLFNVPAAQVPPQEGTDIKVFDKACTDVPTVAPTPSSANDGRATQQEDQQQAAAALTCNVAPTASIPDTGAPAPLASPAATTAEKCQEQCAANSACQCFAFGLAADAAAPTCRLFNVPAAQVPSQGDDIMVFDKACTDVPTVEPTRSSADDGKATQEGAQQGSQDQKKQGQN